MHGWELSIASLLGRIIGWNWLSWISLFILFDLGAAMIVGIEGGMGNQLFQLAFGKSVAKRRGEELYFTRYRIDSDPNGRVYELHHFKGGQDLKFVEHEEPPVVADNWYFNQTVWTQGKSFTGHWQSEKYFDAPLVHELMQLQESPSAGALRWADRIKSGPSCMVHVRRGDYLLPDRLACHGNVSMDFYRRAKEHIGLGVHFFIFSDDPAWCIEAFPDDTVVRWPRQTAHEDLWLMSLCNHAIFPNSTFGWWGAWLGDTQPNRIVIGPKRWFVIGQNSSDVIPERWLKFDN